MADNSNRELNVARLDLELQQQLTNIKASRYRQIQIQAENKQIEVNIAAAQQAADGLEKELEKEKEAVNRG